MIHRVIGAAVVALGVALVACAPSPGATGAPRKNLNWVVIDEANGIYTACATDGIRLFRHNSTGGIAAAPDHSCDK